MAAPPRRVCVAVDSSASSQSALQWAAEQLVNRGEELRILTVVPPSVRSEIARSGHFQGTVFPPTEADPEDLRRSRELLQQCQRAVEAQGVKAGQVVAEPVVAATGAGDARDIGRAIATYAEDCGCETLVMGARGLGFSKRALFNLLGVGSVSDYVVHHVNCNVVVHKDEAAIKAAKHAAKGA